MDSIVQYYTSLGLEARYAARDDKLTTDCAVIPGVPYLTVKSRG